MSPTHGVRIAAARLLGGGCSRRQFRCGWVHVWKLGRLGGLHPDSRAERAGGLQAGWRAGGLAGKAMSMKPPRLGDKQVVEPADQSEAHM